MEALRAKSSEVATLRDVFISYAHLDNQLNPQITHEVTDAIDHFLEVYHYVCDVPTENDSSDLFFLDRTFFRDDDPILESVRHAIEDCSVMLAFYSPRYFRSYHCLQEYKEFKNAQAGELEEEKRAQESGGTGRVPKLLIPIEVRPVDPEKIEPIDDLTPRWISELTGAHGLKHGVTSDILLAKDTTQLALTLRGMDEVIQNHILQRRGSSGERRAASNILTLQAKIERDSLKSPSVASELQERSQHLKYNKLDPVCVIYAGGTVGMVHNEDSDLQHADYEMAQSVDAIVKYLRLKLSALPFNMHFFSLEKIIDSSNVTAGEWVNLANLVREQMANYQGFVILHGTNTLAYSASALSFLLSDTINKPVVFTGSEVPISVHNTDAIHNVENAIRATAWQSYNGPMRVPEVCVYWNNHLYRGNRTTKKYASDRTASFHTPNMAVPLATLANEKLNVEHAHIHVRPEAATMAAVPGLGVVNMASANVSVMFIHPDMDLSNLDIKRVIQPAV